MDKITKEQFINLLRFIAIFGYKEEILKESPDYILEKFSRFIGTPSDINDWNNPGGIHVILEGMIVDKYMSKWKPIFKEENK